MKVARLRKAYVAIASGWFCTVHGFGCAAVYEGDLARSAWDRPDGDPSRRVRCEWPLQISHRKRFSKFPDL